MLTAIDKDFPSYLDRSGNLELEYLENVVFIHKKREDEKIIDKFNRSMVRVLNREWQGVAKRALRKGLREINGNPTVTQASQIIAAIDGELRSFSSKSSRVFNRQIEMAYEALVGSFLKKHRLNFAKATEGPRAQISFSQVDQDAIRAIQRISNQAAGELFPEQVVGKVAEVVSEVVIEQGLPAAEAAAVLETELAGALGIDELGKAIPTRFKTNPQDYFDTLANNASILSNNVGSLVAMNDAGVEKYRVVIIEDKRTSNICLAMKDRVISVEAGMEMVNRLVRMNSATELKNAFPWDSRRRAGDIGPRTLSNNNSIASSGLGFPPYHGKCRSIVVPVFE